jgi:hypothetical protein
VLLENMIAIGQLIVHGVPGRYPKMKIINSHLGGAILFQ